MDENFREGELMHSKISCKCLPGENWEIVEALLKDWIDERIGSQNL